MRQNYKSLHEFIARLEEEGELIRIKEEVSPILEITEITDRVSKSPDGGKALLFENVKDHSMPVLINAFGSKKRMAMALGVNNIELIASEIKKLIETKPPQKFSEKIGLIPTLFDLIKIPPKKFKGGTAPCQEVILTGDNIDLKKLPVIKCWPNDGGRFITLPVVFTRSPVTGKRNTGMYRMHVYDKNTTGMHWHIHKDGAGHFEEYKKLKKRMEVAVAIGTDPVVTFSATAPMPPGVDELLLAGFIRKKGVELVKCKTVNLEVPAYAEIILEGYVDPEESRIEGPFGDHTGYYSLAAPYPIFHVTAVTHRHSPVYSTTIVGKPPMEDCYIGKATERIFLPMLKTINPDISDISLPWEGVFHNCVIVAINKRYPYQARHTMNNLWGTGQMSFSKMILAVDDGMNIHNYSEVTEYLLNHIDLSKDLFFSEGILDVLDHSAAKALFGSKLGIDATGTERLKCKIPDIPSDKEILKFAKELSSDVRDISVPVKNVKSPILFISLKKAIPHTGKKIAQSIFNDPRSAEFKIVLAFDEDVDVKNISYAVWKFFNNVDPKRDFHFIEGKLGIDATRKWKEEGYHREWPNEIKMTVEVKRKIDEMWEKLGMS
ncbi:MAG TPA: menaquinone biosynthesis decarboxylase [Nitrospinota bacterium]|nr:menaquinone biosynthesis decarboxylase [Nitrospinota bacterium]